jgi:hypothetical protein
MVRGAPRPPLYPFLLGSFRIDLGRGNVFRHHRAGMEHIDGEDGHGEPAGPQCSVTKWLCVPR